MFSAWKPVAVRFFRCIYSQDIKKNPRSSCAHLTLYVRYSNGILKPSDCTLMLWRYSTVPEVLSLVLSI